MNDREYPVLKIATAAELAAAEALYRAAVGRPGCTWNEFYPTREDAENDLSHGCLYVGTLGDEILASISVVPENELDGYVFFDGKNAREIARITVAEQYAGRDYAALLLRQLFEKLKKDGVSSVRLLAAKRNTAALKTYENLGFQIKGEVSAYGNKYYAEELIL